MNQSLQTYFSKGMDFFHAGDYPNAIEMFTSALRLSLGDLAKAALYRGICYAYLENYDQAFADFNQALRHDIYLADAYNERGSIYQMRGDFHAALEDYNHALHIDDRHYAAYYNRGLTLEELGHYPEAEHDLSQAIDLNPSIAPAYEVRGRIRALLEDYGGAITDLQRYLRMGGGREYDNHSEVQSFILNLRLNRLLSRVIPARFLRGNRF